MYRSFFWILFLKTVTAFKGAETLVPKINDSLVVEPNVSSVEEQFRLPNSTFPIHYVLEVIHILEDKSVNSSEKFTSPGTVWIDVEVLEDIRSITLHADELEIHTILVTNSADGTGIGVQDFLVQKEVQFLVINLNRTLIPGQYRIQIDFTARIADDRLNGLYLDYYLDPTTRQKQYLATTLFAPNHARKAFPCFDEPGLRATFDISIGHLGQSYFALSNMESINSSLPIPGREGYVWTKFKTTPSMSTYIVAMITCNFSFSTSVEESSMGKNETEMSNSKVDFRIYTWYTQVDVTASTNYSMFMMKKVLPLMETYFGEKYPLPKLYAISLPHFFFSAMENWGMMTLKDPVLLSVPGVTTEVERERIAGVLNHELSHQYFGNLVGLSWWNAVWLKEGFSNFYAAKLTEWSYPEFVPWLYFTTSNLQVAVAFDEGFESHPLDNMPKTSSDIAGIYTRIPYEKGASILRMIEAFMGPKRFHEGVKVYIKRMKYKGASEYDLFDALQSIEDQHHSSFLKNFGSQVTFTDIVRTWTSQSGFPLITVQTTGESMLQITQEKFVNPHVSEIKRKYNATLDIVNETTHNSSWWIPVTLWPKISCNSSLNVGADIWIPQGQDNVFVEYHNAANLFIVNPSTTGYYRVLYKDETYQRLIAQLTANHTVLPSVSRSQLLDDAFSLAFADYVPMDYAFNLTHYLDKEVDLIVWRTVTTRLSRIYNMLRTTSHFAPFQEFMMQKMDPAYQWAAAEIEGGHTPVEVNERKQLQGLLLLHMCQYQPTYCGSLIETYYQRVNDSVSRNLSPVPPHIQSTVFCAILANDENESASTTWELFEKLYRDELFPVQKLRYLKALSCTKQTSLLQRLLNWTLADEMHDVEKVQLVNYVAENSLSSEILLPFLSSHFDVLFKNASSGNPVVEGIKALTPYFNTHEQLTQLGDFITTFTPKLGEGKKKTLIKEMSKVELNLLWMEKFPEKISQWIRSTKSEIKVASSEPNNDDFVHSTC